MDSLLATYASSDEDDEPQQEQQHHHHRTNSTSSNTKTTTTTSSLSLPQPKQPNNNLKQTTTTTLSSSKTLFSALPQPKSQPKKIVQIKPSFNPITRPQNDDEDDDDDGNEKPRRNEVSQSSLQTNSVKSFFATIPAPRNSNSLGSGFASSRRGIVETGESVEGGIDVSGAVEEQNQLVGEENVVNYDNYVDPGSGNYAGYEGYQAGVGIDSGSGNYEGYQGGVVGVDQSAMGDAGYGYYGSYGNTWGEGSGNVGMGRGAEMFSGSGDSESALRVLGKKRGRKDVPAEIVEVKQDELMKNRPREDQVKLTGIAFGPSYKPVSTAGKPTKLHKRKHQIGSLYYDMKQKEMELQERRAKGFLTKAETQAKYGW